MKPSLLRNIANGLLITGGLLVLSTMIAFAGVAIYEWAIPPGDMHLPGLMTATMMVFVAPIGVLMLIIGGLIRITLYLLGNRKSGKDAS